MKLVLKVALLVAIGLLLCGVPAGSPRTGQAPQPCTRGASSIILGEPPVTTWYPPGCVHP
ncbi:MAG TPA: hypothetical protein VFB35_04915 [Gaiellaceae bacterium]|nr:hypothetical protein [Gaiellaceae bacterium]